MTTWRHNLLKSKEQQQKAATPSAKPPAQASAAIARTPPKVPHATVGDPGNQTGITFSHPSSEVGSLTIETGIDLAQWGYNLNVQVYPTYGGEVVQILSVYIDDLQLGGSVSTYSQMEAIYAYFARYMQIATQGRDPHPEPGISAYNLQPITFHYPERGWVFEIMVTSMPGFYYGQDVVNPSWRLGAHVVDDSANTNPTLNSIKNQISDQTVQKGLEQFAKLNGEISPDMKDPNTMPFMVFTGNTQQGQQSISNYADYFNTITSNYAGTDPSSIPGSAPAPAPTHKPKKLTLPHTPKRPIGPLPKERLFGHPNPANNNGRG